VDINKEKLEHTLDFLNVKLKGADLREANIEGVQGLKVMMLLDAYTLYQVKGLDPELERELKSQKPELFEYPRISIINTLKTLEGIKINFLNLKKRPQ
jgi:hypothetical protein